MTHFTGYRDELIAHETPAQRIQRTLRMDELTRTRPVPTLAWVAEVDAMRAVPGDPFDARIWQ